MDLQNVWQQSGANDDVLNKLLQQKEFDKIQSKLPLKKLKINLRKANIWALFITAGYVTLLFLLHFWQVDVALLVLIIFNVWIMLQTWKLNKKIPSTIIPASSLKQELTNNYNSFQKWWSLQLKVSLLVYPIATAGGFIIGGVMSSGRSVESFLYNTKMLIFLGITVLVFVPLSYLGARWMFAHAYGKHLKKLKLLIDELSN